MAAIAYLMVIIVYLPQLSAPPKVTSITQTISHLKGLDYQNSLVDKIYNLKQPFIIPKDYFKGLVMVVTHAGGGHDSYLLGHYSKIGWWYYFPVAFVLKTPLAMIILLVILIIYLIKKKSWQITDSVFAGSILIYLAAAMISRADLGVRHLMPIYLLLAVWLSQIVGPKIRFKYKEIIIGGLLVWFFAISLFAYPNYLSYFNELTGGSKNGWKYLSDSNLDWGQDLVRLDKFMDEKNLNEIYLDYSWLSDEAIYAYGINFERVSPEQQNNLHGFVAIGAGKMKQYEALRARASETYQIENSLFVFKVD